MRESPAPASAQVNDRATIGLVDGMDLVGRLPRFSPAVPDITVHLDEPDSTGRSKQILPTERVAYVAFLRGPSDPPRKPAERGNRYKVHCLGRKLFTVQLAPAESTSAVGFSAYPVDSASAYREFFFYNHGIRARERDEPLGEMLVSDGRLKPEALKRALEEHGAQRAVPIGQILLEWRKVSQSDIDKATALQERRHLRIGEVLTQEGITTQQDIEHALQEQRRRKGKRLGEVLVELNLVSEQDLVQTLARKFDIAFVDLDKCTINPEAAAAVPRDLIARYGVLPVDIDTKAITVAISDPLALEPLDVLRFRTNRRIDEVLVRPSQLKQHVEKYLAQADSALENKASGAGFEDILKELANDAGLGAQEDDAPADATVNPDKGIISLVNRIILDAFRRNASDIHIEPNGKDSATAVRFRIDGDCVLYQEVPAAHRGAMVARIKIMSKLDISERRKPQDGKIKFRLPDRQLELRVATIPTVSGDEDVVLRLLAGQKPLPLDRMRLSDRNLNELRRIITQPYGLILCVGPTGSGKTTTLHSALGAINTVDMKIWTAEDPVEITQPGLRQVQVNARIGFTFAQAMRAFLRADPDVIMVGEMRDQETASTAIEASLTGHLVFSTLHTNSAPETITRLLDMGLDPFSFADALLGVLAQRLARGLCPNCKRQDRGTRDEYGQMARPYGDKFEEELGVAKDDFMVWRAPGCEACGGTGYKARIGIHELLATDDTIKRAILKKSTVDELRTIAMEQGMRTLLQDGIAKAYAGLTDMKQVLAVCSK